MTLCHFTRTEIVNKMQLPCTSSVFEMCVYFIRSIDKLGTNVISQEEFRAAIESRFNLTLTDSQFESFIDRIPLDEDGYVRYADFMQLFDTK